MQKIKVLTGTTLSLLISVVSVYPAMAGPVSELAQQNSIAQADSTGNITGKIRSIVGDVITLELANGDTKTVSLTRSEILKQSLVPGMYVTINSTGTEVSLAQPTRVAQQNISTTTTTIQSSPSTINSQTNSAVSNQTTESTTATQSTTTQINQTTTTQVRPLTPPPVQTTPVVQEAPVTTTPTTTPSVETAPVIIPQAW